MNGLAERLLHRAARRAQDVRGLAERQREDRQDHVAEVADRISVNGT